MKIYFPLQMSVARAHAQKAMTLPEMMTATAVFIMLMGGMLQLHMYGLLHDQVVSSKLGASDTARLAFDRLLQEIRASKGLRVGTNSGTNFVNTPAGNIVQGNALRLYLNTNTSQYIQYYFEPNGSDNEVRRITNGMTGYEVLAEHINNTNIIFTAEDYRGSVLSNDADGDVIDNHTVISALFEFFEYKYPKTKVGSNYLYDYYKLEFKATTRNFD
jgi:hypothetical protein